MKKQDGGLALNLTCTLNAPLVRTYRMLTDPAELATWWGPSGFTMPQAEVDLRVGGAYRFSMQPPDGQLFHLSGEFVEVDPPSRLVYTFRWDEPTPDDRETVVTLTLDDVAGSTVVALSQGSFTTEERLALHRGGWTDSFERLRDAIESSS